MNRRDRLAAVLDPDTADQLATLPAAQVDLIVKAVRASRRAAIAEDKARRAERRRQAKAHAWTEDEKAADACDALVTRSLVPRAGQNTLTLARLAQHYAAGPANMLRAVNAARANGYSDGEIAAALGITRQAVGQRFGRRGMSESDTGR